MEANGNAQSGAAETDTHAYASRPLDTTENASRIRILLLEHQSLVQTALATLIDAVEGMQVVATADTVADAERAAESLRPDIVLLSIAGEWSVFGAAGRIGEQFPDIKVILLDERSLDSNVREALRVRAAGYLTKEQPFHEIATALRRAAHGERVFAPDIGARLLPSADGVRLARDTSPGPLESLTPREIDVLIHLARGYTVKQCAKALGIGTSTAGNHKSRMMKKLRIHKTVDLTRLAMREGLVAEGRGPVQPPHAREFDAAIS